MLLLRSAAREEVVRGYTGRFGDRWRAKGEGIVVVEWEDVDLLEMVLGGVSFIT